MTMLAALLCCGVMTVSAEGEENLAAGCAVEACGFNAYGGLTADVREAPELAVDGDADTKWDCNVQEHEGLEDGTLHWLILDLGESKTFNKIELKHASNCTIDKDYPEYNTREMVIETSEDKENWTECLHILNGDQKAVNTRWFDAVRARYIRLRILAPGTKDTDARLVEFAVYNSSEEPVEEADVPLGAAIATTGDAADAPTTAPLASGGVNSAVQQTDGGFPTGALVAILVVIGVLMIGGVVIVIIHSRKKN